MPSQRKFETFRVTELVRLFQASLIALIPVMDRARIAWRGPMVYDPWENIERALFQSIITSCVQNAIGKSIGLPLAPYGLLMRSYRGHSFLSSHDASGSGPADALVELETRSSPFDTAILVELNSELDPSDRQRRVNVAETEFRIAMVSESGHPTYHDSVTYQE